MAASTRARDGQGSGPGAQPRTTTNQCSGQQHPPAGLEQGVPPHPSGSPQSASPDHPISTQAPMAQPQPPVQMRPGPIVHGSHQTRQADATARATAQLAAASNSGKRRAMRPCLARSEDHPPNSLTTAPSASHPRSKRGTHRDGQRRTTRPGPSAASPNCGGPPSRENRNPPKAPAGP